MTATSPLRVAEGDVAANRRFLQTPDPRPDPAPYQKALRTL